MRVEGKLVRHHMGMGGWLLEPASGKAWWLMGVPEAPPEGQQVWVEGEAVEALGFAMMDVQGVLRVVSLGRLSGDSS